MRRDRKCDKRGCGRPAAKVNHTVDLGFCIVHHDLWHQLETWFNNRRKAPTR